MKWIVKILPLYGGDWIIAKKKKSRLFRNIWINDLCDTFFCDRYTVNYDLNCV